MVHSCWVTMTSVRLASVVKPWASCSMCPLPAWQRAWLPLVASAGAASWPSQAQWHADPGRGGLTRERGLIALAAGALVQGLAELLLRVGQVAQRVPVLGAAPLRAQLAQDLPCAGQAAVAQHPPAGPAAASPSRRRSERSSSPAQQGSVL